MGLYLPSVSREWKVVVVVVIVVVVVAVVVIIVPHSSIPYSPQVSLAAGYPSPPKKVI